MTRSTAVVGALLGALWTGSPSELQAHSVQGPNPTAGAPDTLTLTFQAAQRLALTNNPAVLAAGQQLPAANARLRQARVWRFNPEFGFESESLPSGGAFDRYEGGLSQEVEWAGQRGLRIRAAEFDVVGSEHSVQDAERLTRIATAEAFLSGLVATRRRELAEEMLPRAQRLLDAVSAQLEAGAISVLEANLARIDVGRARARVQSERRNAETALFQLKLLGGLPIETVVRLDPALPPVPDPASIDVSGLVTRAVAERPDLAAAASLVEESATLLRLSQRERIPNITLVAPFERLEGESSGEVGVGVGFSIPLWNRKQGIVAERTSELNRARFERDAVELRVRSEVVEAYERFASAYDEAVGSEADVLEPARLNRSLLEEAYEAGKIDLPTLLLLRNQLLDAELEYWDSWLASRIELERFRAVTAGFF